MGTKLERAAVLTAIYNAVDELNPQLAEERRLEKGEAVLVFGEDAPFDSLDLVNFVMIVEQNILDETGEELVLASEAAMSRKRSPYRSIGALADYALEVAEGVAAE
ncbi:MAG: hypothetical protein AAFX03_03290 [Pseudomonadota bacterium]